MDKNHEIQRLLPSYVEEKHNYIKIDGTYMVSLIVTSYPDEISMMQIIENFLKINDASISIVVKKENTMGFLKHITNTIAKNSAEIKTASKNQLDIPIISKTTLLAKEIREKIQIYNEEVYRLKTYITLYDKNIETLYVKAKDAINKLYSGQIIVKFANFKHKEIYLLTLPLLITNNFIDKYTNRIITTSSLAYMFPFYIKQIRYNNGVIIGKVNDSMCTIDLLDSRNINYNMCVFGSSGAGKSYFIKSLIIKNAYKGITQIIVDPEGEYVEFTKKLGGRVIAKDNHNIFYIYENYLKSNPENFLNNKIEAIIDTIIDVNLTEEKELKALRKIIMSIYMEKGISSSVDSLYTNGEEDDVIFIDKKYISQAAFPTIKDFLTTIKVSKEIEPLFKNKIYNNINRIYKNKTKNLQEETEKIYCVNLKSKNLTELQSEMKMHFHTIEELICKDSLIYFDEVWKIINNKKDSSNGEKINELFKTIRKRKTGIIAITQDVSDLFKYNNGEFGKSIVNNSFMKVLFRMEYSDISIIKNISVIDDETLSKIAKLERGHAIMNIGITKFEIKIQTTKHEHNLIEEGEVKYEKDTNSNG